MPQFSFYQVMDALPASVDRALPKLLEKALGAGHKIVVACPTAERARRLNDTLWNYDSSSFLPHGTEEDGNAELQPVYITAEGENPNSADILLKVSGAAVEDVSAYSRVLDVFEAAEGQKQSARKRYKALKDEGAELTYFAYEGGKWVNKG